MLSVEQSFEGKEFNPFECCFGVKTHKLSNKGLGMFDTKWCIAALKELAQWVISMIRADSNFTANVLKGRGIFDTLAPKTRSPKESVAQNVQLPQKRTAR